MHKILKPLAFSGIAICVALSVSAAMAKPNDESNTKKLKHISQVADRGPFKANWDSMANYKIPTWYQDAKFGIFIHWGVYSVPAYNDEWYPRHMYSTEPNKLDYYKHHVKTHGPVDKFGYKDFIPLFKAEKFDAKAWAKVIKDSGAKYVIPVAEHHDGFPMYDSQYTKWNAVKMGPKRDIIQELSESMRAAGIIFGLSSHRAENWWFFGEGRKRPSDVQDDQYRELYGRAADRVESNEGKTPPSKEFLDDWLLRTVEIVDKYKPQIIWFDWWMAKPVFNEHLKQFASYYYNEGSTWDDMVAINYKKIGGESFPDTAGVLDIERGQRAEIRELFWQTDTAVSKNSWSYVTNNQYKTVNSLVDDLIDIVSKNGSMLLNIGPKPDGTIPQKEIDMLNSIGNWLKINGEAIYETRPWYTFGEGTTKVKDGTFLNNAETSRSDFNKSDIRFTQKDGNIYALLMEWPGDKKKIRISSAHKSVFKKGIKNITMLGSSKKLRWKLKKAYLQVKLPKSAPANYAQVLKIEPNK